MDEKLQHIVLSPIWEDWYGTNSRQNCRRCVFYGVTTFLLMCTFVYTVLARPSLLGHHAEFLEAVQFVPTEYPSPANELLIDRYKQEPEGYCPQVKPLLPNQIPLELDPIRQEIWSTDFRDESIEKFRQSIRFKTISEDAMKNETLPFDAPQYEQFLRFREFLESNWTNVWNTMHPRLINHHTLLYAWKGTDNTLKPILLYAHYDVVPVSEQTESLWTHKPFSGDLAADENGDKKVWGRGAIDMKHGVVAIMNAMDVLIRNDFEPRRTIMIVFAHDEELGGLNGAKIASSAIHDCVGEGGIAVMVDEGGGTFDMFGAEFSSPSVAEKGTLDAQIDIRVPGGHSSLPSVHTGVGIAGAYVTRLENEQYNTYLNDEHPFLKHLACSLEHAGDGLPSALKQVVKARLDGTYKPSIKNDSLAWAVSKGEGATADFNSAHWIMTTTQAATVINGGFKINALPDLVQLVINHRIHIAENLTFVKQRLESHARAIADRFDLTVYGFNETKGDTTFKPPANVNKSISLTVLHELAIAPISPTTLTSNGKDTVYAITAGTIKAVMGEQKIVSPVVVTGNTDSRHFWNVTNNFMRFTAGPTKDDSYGVHTIDESCRVSSHIRGIDWFSTFIRNMDQADLDDDRMEKPFTCWDER